jgi:hypothetical protein
MFQPKAEPEVDINELMARLNAGRDRAAREKLERDAKAAESRESTQLNICYQGATELPLPSNNRAMGTKGLMEECTSFPSGAHNDQWTP